MDESSAALEAELASLALEAESELLRETGAGPGDTSVASSQLTDFLVQHGVLSPMRPRAAASLGASSSSFAATGGGVGRAAAMIRQPQQEQQQRQQQQRAAAAAAAAAQDVSLSYEVVMTPERRHRQEQEGEAEAPSHTPRSGISSLGLASPPHRPMPTMPWGTGGEPLQQQQQQRPPRTSEAGPSAPVLGATGGSASAGSSGAEWAAVSQLLRSEGYRTGSGQNRDGEGEEPEAVLYALRQVMRDLREGREVLRAQLLDRQRGDSDRRAVEAQLEGAERAGRTLNESLAAAQARARALEGEVDKAKRAGLEQARAAKAKASQLAAQLRQSEQRVKEREAQIDKMAARLEAAKEREAREKEREKAIFRRMAQREPRPNEGKWAEMLGALDGARRRSEEEAEALREEVAALNAAVREKEKYIARHEMATGSGAGAGTGWGRGSLGESTSAAAGAGAGAGGGPGLQHLLEQVQGLEKELRLAEKRAEAATRRAEALETGRLQLAARVEELEGEQAGLRRELQARPTSKAWRGAQKRLEEMDAQLTELQEADRARRAKAAAGPARRVSLSGVDASSAEELRSLVGAVCRALELAGPGQVLPAVEALRAAMEAIPPLEAFVKDVCAFLARETLPGGAHLSPDEALKRMDLPGAQRALRAWAKEVRAVGRLRRFQSRLRTIVSTRTPGGGGGVGGQGEENDNEEDEGVLVLDDEQLLATVQSLVALEHRTQASQGARAAAEAYLAGRPELLVNRAVQHFCYLFEVKSGLEGVLPKMNELYLFAAEMGALVRALRAALRLSPTCPTNKLLAELQALIRKARRATAAASKGASGGQEEDEDDASLLLTDPNSLLNLSTVDEEEEEEEDETEMSNGSADEGERISSAPPTPAAAAPSLSLSNISSSSPAQSEGEAEMDEQGQERGQQQEQGEQQQRPPPPSSSFNKASASSQRHPMLAVLSAAESQESPFLPQPARRRAGGSGPGESPALFVASSKMAATAGGGNSVSIDDSSSDNMGGTPASEAQQQRRRRPVFEESVLSTSSVGGPYPAFAATAGRSSRSGSGYGAGRSGSNYNSNSGGGSLGLLGVLSAAESGGSLPSPAAYSE